jgi:hypothetical protein
MAVSACRPWPLEQGIPVIAVRNNTNLMRNRLSELPFAPGQLLFAENYFEAAGLMAALKSGIAPAAVRRPIGPARVERVGARDHVASSNGHAANGRNGHAKTGENGHAKNGRNGHSKKVLAEVVGV